MALSMTTSKGQAIKKCLFSLRVEVMSVHYFTREPDTVKVTRPSILIRVNNLIYPWLIYADPWTDQLINTWVRVWLEAGTVDPFLLMSTAVSANGGVWMFNYRFMFVSTFPVFIRLVTTCCGGKCSKVIKCYAGLKVPGISLAVFERK